MSAVSNSRFHTTNNNGRRRRATEEEAPEPGDNSNLVRLCINKPKSWNWELTTSKSSPSIAFPRIQLYEKASGALLAEADEADCQIRGRGSSSTTTTSLSGTAKAGYRVDQQQHWRRCASIPEKVAESRDEELVSTSGQPSKVSHYRSRSWQNDEISNDKQQQQLHHRRTTSGSNPGSRRLVSPSVDEVLNGIVDQYAREGVNCTLNYHHSNRRSHHRSSSREAPITQSFALGRSKSTTYVPITKAASNSSSTGGERRKKKRYRRAQSVNSLRFSNSILERIREYKRCTSSSSSPSPSPSPTPPCLSEAEEDKRRQHCPEEESAGSHHLSPRKIRMVQSATDIPAEHATRASEEDIHRPKYSLRTSKAGTIVVCEESFRHRKVRRRPRSLTRSSNDAMSSSVAAGDEQKVAVFSPERVKTMFEYVGRLNTSPPPPWCSSSRIPPEGQRPKPENNRYQREIDNIDKILEKLQGEKATEVMSGKSCPTRRHKSLTDRHRQESVGGVGDGSVEVDANSEAEKRATIRSNSHQRGSSSKENLSIDGRLNNGLLMKEAVNEGQEEFKGGKKSDSNGARAKRISFGKTTFKTKSTENDEEDWEGQPKKRMDINDVVNNRWGLARRTIASEVGIVSGRGVRDGRRAEGELQRCTIDKDKLRGQQQQQQRRRQVRRMRRSLSADHTPRLSNLALSSNTTTATSSSSESESDNGATAGDVNDGDNRESASKDGCGRHRGRSRTRRRRRRLPQGTAAASADGSIHKLIVQGDQVVAINNAEASSPTKEQQTAACLIEPTDQVLLRLVRRLASLQTHSHHPPHDTKSISDNPEVERKHKLLLWQWEQQQQKRLNERKTTARNQEHTGGSFGVGGAPERGCVQQLDINNNSSQQDGGVDKENMGSNVSRHNGKGLSGRRSLSSGNVFNGKSNLNQSPVVTKGGTGDPKGVAGPAVPARINKRFHGLLVPTDTISSSSGAVSGGHEKESTDTCSVNRSPSPSNSATMMAPGQPNKRDRNKLCGSLPNYLDVDDADHDDQLQLTSISRAPKSDDPKPEYVTVSTSRTPSASTNNTASVDYVGGIRPPGSPFNTSSSGKGSIASSNLGSSSTFKSLVNGDAVSTPAAAPVTLPQQQPPMGRLELKLPVQHRVNFDTGCDQGYGSERSPEEEVPPTLPSLANGGVDSFNFINGPPALMLMGQPPATAAVSAPATSTTTAHEAGLPTGQMTTDEDRLDCEYEFITKDCTFFVQITKGARGLGLSISGGVDSTAAFPGLIRIKRLFPHQAAWATGQLQPGDIILEVNGQPLSGLTNYEALEVLRTAPNEIMLTVCRPEDENYRKLSPPSEPPRPPERAFHPPTSLPLEPLTPLQTNFSGEFELIMVKQTGSLGFTLRKEDDSVLGHYVRALVRKPATDGIIKPGDKIVAVNDVPLSPMSHEEAVIFLRQADDTVKLRLYRDLAQTPVAAMSPTNPERGFASSSGGCSSGTSTLQKKQFLRPEAINLLSDLAYRKQTPPYDSSGSSVNSGSNTSPRRLKRGVNKGGAGGGAGSGGAARGQSTSNFSDSEASTLSQGSFSIQQVAVNYGSGSSGAEETYTIVEDGPESADFESISDDQQYYRNEEIQDVVLDDDYDVYSSTDSRGSRPSYLHLVSGGGGVGGVGGGAMYPFELNNLDNDLLDAPMYKQLPGSPGGGYGGGVDLGDHSMSDSQEFVSLPCDTFIVAENDLKRRALEGNHFQHRNPVYQSVQLSNNGGGGGSSLKESSANVVGSGGVVGGASVVASDGSAQKDGTKSLMKWKGVILGGGREEDEPQQVCRSSDAGTSSIVITSSGSTTADECEEPITNRIKPNDATNFDGYKPPITLELNRGWNSRLGFSLKLNESTHRTYISAIYSDSVAARDGRLRIGDEITRVNDESVENMSTSQIIDLLRIVRGAICLTVLRKEQSEEDGVSTEAEST